MRSTVAVLWFIALGHSAIVLFVFGSPLADMAAEGWLDTVRNDPTRAATFWSRNARVGN